VAIASDNVFPKIIGAEQGSDPAAPAASQRKLYAKADGWYDIDDAGTVTGPLGTSGGGSGTFVGCKAVRSAVQSLTNNTNTAIAFNATDEYDTNAIHDPATNNTRLTVPAGKGGVWRFTYSIEFATNATGLRTAFFSINGTPKVPDGTQRVPAVSGETTRLTGTADLLLSATDYVETVARQTSGGALDVTAICSAEFRG
jgi:hypothetical protein